MEPDCLDDLFRLVLQQTQEGVILSDADGNIVFVHDAAERIRNVKRENLIGHSMVDCHKDAS